MKILIEEAERLRRQIDEAQVHLINARLQKDEEGKKSAISEMETTMCNAIQLLTCLVERKDNIVDLREVWHNTSITEEADRKKSIILDSLTVGDYYIPNRITFYSRAWIDCICAYNFRRWAYVSDLLPK